MAMRSRKTKSFSLGKFFLNKIAYKKRSKALKSFERWLDTNMYHSIVIILCIMKMKSFNYISKYHATFGLLNRRNKSNPFLLYGI